MSFDPFVIEPELAWFIGGFVAGGVTIAVALILAFANAWRNIY